MEAFTKKKPNFINLKPFGEKCYVVLDKAQRVKRSTLDPKADKSILLGVDPMGYLVELPSGRRMVSCHVKFMKTDEEDAGLQSVDHSDSESEDEQDYQSEKSQELEETFTTPQSSPLTRKIKPGYSYQEKSQLAPKDINLKVSTENMISDINKRSTRQLESSANLITVTPDPSSYNEAITGKKSHEWRSAIKAELSQLMANGTFGSPEPLPNGRTAVKHKWVFKTKYHQDNTIDKYKARLCAKGFTQREGVDFDEVFAPVVSIITLRLLLSMTVILNLNVTVYDVTGAYLYPKLDKELYMWDMRNYHTTKMMF